MSATQEVSRFPRVEGEYVVSEKVLEDGINRALSVKLNVDFPSSLTSPHLSTCLGTYTITPALKELLVQRGFFFGSGILLSNKEMSFGGRNSGSGHWSFVRDFSIRLFAEWRRTLSGVTLTINTVGYTTEQKRNRVCDFALTQCIKDYGENMHPLIQDLLRNDGELHLSWQDLNLEPIVPVLLTFEKEYLAQRFTEALGITVKYIAQCDELSPFDPNPYTLEGHGSDCTVRKFVPEAAQTELTARWNEQYMNFVVSLRPE